MFWVSSLTSPIPKVNLVESQWKDIGNSLSHKRMRVGHVERSPFDVEPPRRAIRYLRTKIRIAQLLELIE